jgi:sugar O-acyltransferase (sialic acid O-acetyltransferase NeuD family)
MKQKTPLVIVGAGGFAREVFRAVAHCHVVTSFVAEGEKGNRAIHGIPVKPFFHKNDQGHFFIVAVGDPKTRERLFNRALAAGLVPCPPVVHPTAWVGDAELGEGSIVCANTSITTNVKVGKSVIINLNCTIGHDAVLKSFVTVSPGANISGNVIVGERSYIGTGATIREKIKVGAQSVLGMGAVLVKELPDGQVWGGVPAAPLSKTK